MKTTINFLLNGKKYTKEVEMHWTLLRFLRDVMGLTGTKEGCGKGECGTCTVLLNGKAVRSCLVLACEVDGGEIITIEGLNSRESLDIIQQAFLEAGAVQCGFCTPGLIMAIKGIMMETPKPTKDMIIKALSGHLCRCTGYESILQAVELIVNRSKSISK